MTFDTQTNDVTTLSTIDGLAASCDRYSLHYYGGKRGRGTDQTPVLVSVSLNKQGVPQFVQIASDPQCKRETIIDIAQRSIEPGATISCDAYRSYNTS
ncbi:transposase [Paenibacillus koleovorans]|uniref:transposase n=1 Tax=Paenibacillus koleovorans TaxID=121608 RepID=UPI0035A24085